MSESKDLQWMFEGREPVRAHLDDQGNPWFVAKDVCRALGILDHQQAVEGLEEDEIGGYTVPTMTSKGEREMRVISESGLFALIFKSRKEQARAFQKWITGTVLPEIRKTGGYRISELQAELDALRRELAIQNIIVETAGAKLKSGQITRAIDFAVGDAKIRARLRGEDEMDDLYVSQRLEHWIRMFGGISVMNTVQVEAVAKKKEILANAMASVLALGE